MIERIHSAARAPLAPLFEDMDKGLSPIATYGVPESGRAILCALIASREPDRRILFIASNAQQATRYFEDLLQLGENAVLLPPREVQFHMLFATSGEDSARRLAALSRARRGAQILVASVDALITPLMPVAAFDAHAFSLRPGQRMEPIELVRRLVAAGYERVTQVEARGQVSLRGGIVDLFPVDTANALRVEFFGDEIDTLRSFDTLTQRSIERVNALELCPAGEAVLDATHAEYAAARLLRELDELIARSGARLPKPVKPKSEALSEEIPSLWEMEEIEGDSKDALYGLDELRPEDELAMRLKQLAESLRAGDRPADVESFLPLLYTRCDTVWEYFQPTLVVMEDPNRVRERCENLELEFMERLKLELERFRAIGAQGEWMIPYGELLARMLGGKLLTMNTLTLPLHDIQPKALHNYDMRSASQFHGQIPALCEELRRQLEQKAQIVLLTGGAARGQRLAQSLQDEGIPVLFQEDREGYALILPNALQHGLEWPEAKLWLLSETDIYGMGKKRSAAKRNAGQKIAVFTDLKPGDPVVHESHGVGIYLGTVRLEVDGTKRDYLHIQYQGGDKLYIPTDQLDRVQKYIGMDGDKQPKLNRLGGSEWEKTKQKVRQSIREMAFDLTKLYAERQNTKGFAFSKDTPWQREFEEKFPFEETPDQLQSVEEIKRDMERNTVMDRLLCGDVGYGKTEVALRAAFKAVMDSKQVAFLVPTTILAQQHFQTLQKRFDGFPITIDVLSRFRTAAEQKQIFQRLAEGKIDVLVGTHALLNKSIRFKDLGLLIIDEEQRFGVQHKEQIKEMRKNVDVLTMTATPIPRTLHMSMVGIRDLSMLETPPEERYPVQTYVVEYQEGLVRDAILREIARGGQVYFVYNRVQSIDKFHAHLREIVPEARIVVAHGQMRENQLEDVMMDFYDGEYDVLLCSTIIETGLDIPAVNTLIVYDADRFGLSQLYQLRGRVGRSNRLAYAYLTVRRDKVLTETAEKRLNVVREFTEFGSGFKIAMRDLEIRGAGNLLGAEQHGHMSAVGYDLYCKLMEQTIRETRGEWDPNAEVETRVDLRVNAFLPQELVRGEQVRVDVYKRIAGIENRDDREDVMEELIDRFGDVPHEMENLVVIAHLKALCQRLSIASVTMRGEQLRMSFTANAQIDPQKLLEALSIQEALMLAAGNPPALVLREKGEIDTLIRKGCDACERLLALLEDTVERAV